MKQTNLKDCSFKTPTVLTIGTFDGVHIGHKKIIERLIATANKQALTSIVLTFFPHPRMVLQKDANIKLLNTIDEKCGILDALGLDHLIIKEFTQEFSRLTAEAFVRDILVNKLNIKKIIIGYDHHFGRNRTANINDLRAFGKTYHFEVEEISAQDINEVAVSSTKIRQALITGDIKTANAYLGYNYMLNGTVIKGKSLGSKLGFPTANIQIKETYKLIPKDGVYVVKALVNDNWAYGMMNIGSNPTVETSNKQFIEAHFFNFKETLYNQQLTIEILHRIRDEKKFDSVHALKTQLQQDQKTAEDFLKTHE
ncbi:riboflavin biosynthesis protein RibF [Mangrovimonas yunxiaonensis]|uniref:Riboflavin biosynthesis protein n=1 Tax=Mangrovimonas yunxiaonensis TaxID=1197477 RepID=A0A084TMQ5_9FLAO|nr:bifunctional riboflavin kinase/FAD synthetase [Mangrovimonas yunxiaonensis]KFB01991.1 riboflavin biosynthesis protein RibF [Mangrovimonas yunxiaonensis]GGH45186.1 riboflavin biosynthesis protein [Mangrovimonas yunxiaonensis]